MASGAKSRVPVGHTLLVPSQQPSNEAALTLAQAVFTTVPAGRTFYYTAKRGDTLQRVAVRYGVTAQELKTWNGVSRDTLAAGQKLRVTSDVVPVAQSGRQHQARGRDPGRGQAGGHQGGAGEARRESIEARADGARSGAIRVIASGRATTITSVSLAPARTLPPRRVPPPSP